MELEIYLFKPYRNKGYGTCVLKRFVDIAFKEAIVLFVGKYGAGIIVWKNVKAVIESCLMKKPLKSIKI